MHVIKINKSFRLLVSFGNWYTTRLVHVYLMLRYWLRFTLYVFKTGNLYMSSHIERCMTSISFAKQHLSELDLVRKIDMLLFCDL